MDQFMEEVASKRKKGSENIMLALAWAALIVSGLIAVFMFNLITMTISTQGFSMSMLLDIVITLLMIASAVLTFLYKDRIKTEYEYTFTNGILDFAKVFNNRKRKTLGTMNVKNVEALGMVHSGSFNRYVNMPSIKRLNWFANRDADLFYMYFQKDGSKSLLVMEPSESMRNMIIRAAGQGKFQQN